MNMDEFEVGDTVRCVHKKLGTLIEGSVRYSSRDWVGIEGIAAISMEDSNWDVSLVERAKPELPTEPGIYLDVRGNVAQLVADTTDYEERWFNEYGQYMTHSGARERAPFTRLESVADTARKVLDAVIARTAMHCNACSGRLADIRKEFGVQS